MFQRTVRVIEHVPVAERTFRVRLECPEIAGAMRPGQFVMLRLPNTTDPLLGRPFALYDTVLDASETATASTARNNGRMSEASGASPLRSIRRRRSRVRIRHRIAHYNDAWTRKRCSILIFIKNWLAGLS